MKVKNSRIFLRNVRFHAYHGVLEQERSVGNDYVVNIVADCDFTHALQTDELQDTVGCAQQVAGTCGRKNRGAPLCRVSCYTESRHQYHEGESALWCRLRRSRNRSTLNEL